jgi:hypothetical protein
MKADNLSTTCYRGPHRGPTPSASLHSRERPDASDFPATVGTACRPRSAVHLHRDEWQRKRVSEAADFGRFGASGYIDRTTASPRSRGRICAPAEPKRRRPVTCGVVRENGRSRAGRPTVAGNPSRSRNGTISKLCAEMPSQFIIGGLIGP